MASIHRPTWFKLHDNYKHVFDALPNENIGEGVKLVMEYFVNGQEPDTNISTFTRCVFDMLKQSVEDAFAEYNAKVEGGRMGGLAKAAKRSADDYDEAEPPF